VSALSKDIFKEDDESISDEQLQTTIATIKLLGKKLNVFRSPLCKELRR
jgi:hypothetical protein